MHNARRGSKKSKKGLKRRKGSLCLFYIFFLCFLSQRFGQMTVREKLAITTLQQRRADSGALSPVIGLKYDSRVQRKIPESIYVQRYFSQSNQQELRRLRGGQRPLDGS